MKKSKLLLTSVLIIMLTLLASCKARQDSSFMSNIQILYANDLFYNNRINESVAIYMNSLSLENSYIYYNLANAFVALDEAESAKENFKLAIEEGDYRVKVFSEYNLATTLFYSSEYKKALDHFREAIIYYEKFLAQEYKNEQLPKKEQAIYKKLSMSYQKALKQSNMEDSEAAVQSGSLGINVDGETAYFSLSRPSEKLLYVSGSSQGAKENDH